MANYLSFKLKDKDLVLSEITEIKLYYQDNLIHNAYVYTDEINLLPIARGEANRLNFKFELYNLEDLEKMKTEISDMSLHTEIYDFKDSKKVKDVGRIELSVAKANFSQDLNYKERKITFNVDGEIERLPIIHNAPRTFD